MINFILVQAEVAIMKLKKIVKFIEEAEIEETAKQKKIRLKHKGDVK